MPEGDLGGLLRQLLDLADAVPAPRAEPIKLTRVQFDQLRAAVPSRPDSDPASALFGVPIVVVNSTTESTPYAEGWIKCPSCGEPANDHGHVVCDRVMVFGPFGDFAVRPPRDFFGSALVFERALAAMNDFRRRQQQLVSDPGVTSGDLERIKASLLDLAASDDEEMAAAAARWEDDGGA